MHCGLLNRFVLPVERLLYCSRGLNTTEILDR